ncbi:MAG: sulfotransferase family protein [Alphaproteobacteria bacterium]|nr:sulfotransferase family protein [Alphaproteobacteria bacterium]
MTPILALWAIPRSTSTAFEWMMRQRGDHVCHHEPFGEAWYRGEDRLCPRETSEQVKPGLTFQSVWRTLQEGAAAERLFMKDFPHYIMHMVDEEFLARFTHSFLIRTPEKMLPSMFKNWPDFEIAETGYAEQRELFDRVCQRDGKAPAVVDSDDLLDDPAATSQAWCEAVGIRFMPDALNWEPGERKQMSWYDGGSWHANLEASTGLKRQKRDYVSVDHNDHLKRAYEVCQPHYEAIYRHRLGG